MSCAQSELLHMHALGALPPSEASAIEAHVSVCVACRQELESLRPVVASFACWPTDVLRPSTSLWDRLSKRIAAKAASEALPSAPARWTDPEWQEVSPGIFCKLLATDAETSIVSMLVRLAPGVAYPPHSHSSTEELHLLDGELWIDDRKLHAGDHHRAEPGRGPANRLHDV